MDEFIAFLNSLLPDGMSWYDIGKSVLILTAAVLILGFLARLLFGKKSLLNRSLSSAINILFIYIVTVCIHALGVNLNFLLAPLPFVSVSGEYLYISVEMEALASELLSMVILSFLANLADSWLPEGKSVIGWFFFRCMSVLLAMLLHVIVTSILNLILPAIVLLWTPRVLLIALGVMLLLGMVKVVFAVTLPLFALLHNFFFKHTVGKMVYQAFLTTLLLWGIFYALDHFGINALYVASSALLGYLPVLVILIGIWFVIGHLL